MSQNIKVLRVASLVDKLGISRSSLYDRLNPRSPRHVRDFPQRIKLGEHAVGWIESEVDAYIATLPRATQSNGGPQ